MCISDTRVSIVIQSFAFNALLFVCFVNELIRFYDAYYWCSKLHFLVIVSCSCSGVEFVRGVEVSKVCTQEAKLLIDPL